MKEDRPGLAVEGPHPCMMEGDFSIFNSPNVGVARGNDVTYSLDMDGFVVLSW